MQNADNQAGYKRRVTAKKVRKDEIAIIGAVPHPDRKIHQVAQAAVPRFPANMGTKKEGFGHSTRKRKVKGY